MVNGRAMPADKNSSHRETLAAQGLGRVALPYRDIVPPIHVATTYERGADGTYPGGRVYSRADNPGYDQAEALIAALEGAAAALLFASGQAAAGAVFQALAPGDARAGSAPDVLGLAQMAAGIRGAVGNRRRVLRKCAARRPCGEGTAAPAAS